ncbi:MAG: glutamine-hydrolyzing GMP synthase, partial [Candidatus Cloacimonetes bacterium]|nr:glutamine-hydrolyzing GMP synthase [Candidatus Cloacimonadota bacterium]
MKEIAIIDFGGQYTHLIARRIRQLGVFSAIYQPEDFSISPAIAGIIFSGGPQSVNAEDAYRIDYDLKNSKVPVLGLCYGHHLIAAMLGGRIGSGSSKEYGFTDVVSLPQTRLFRDLPADQVVWMSHGDHVEELPVGFTVTASSVSLEIAGYESMDGRFFGLQFHPEVSHTRYGMEILGNFLDNCTTERDWKPANYRDSILEDIRTRSGNRRLFLLLSGGVDSLVALELCLQALGKKRIYSIHVDTGFMRAEESGEIIGYLQDLGYDGIKVIKAEEMFLKALEGITDPEQKRRLIGGLFVRLLQQELARLDLHDDWLLVQGTIYPDTIESGAGNKAARIKTHHNRVAEIEELIAQGRVIEPLRELYKDEVRALGLELGLPQALVQRHPFPGPGLAIRIICSTGKSEDHDYNRDYARLNNILLPRKMLGLILPVKSVGVQGDFRTYAHPAVLWRDGDQQVNWADLRATANLIINQLPSINRVVFSLQPLREELNLVPSYLERKNLELLRQVDAFIRSRTAHLPEIWQFPVVSLPF